MPFPALRKQIATFPDERIQDEAHASILMGIRCGTDLFQYPWGMWLQTTFSLPGETSSAHHINGTIFPPSILRKGGITEGKKTILEAARAEQMDHISDAAGMTSLTESLRIKLL
jgi:hypothetical protein